MFQSHTTISVDTRESLVAIRSEEADHVTELLENGANPNAQNEYGTTALLLAAHISAARRSFVSCSPTKLTDMRMTMKERQLWCWQHNVATTLLSTLCSVHTPSTFITTLMFPELCLVIKLATLCSENTNGGSRKRKESS